jgi:hypothetical protein
MRRFLVPVVVVAATLLALLAAPGCSITGNCNLGLTDCGNGLCTSLASDVYNCGACGHVCPNGTVCAKSVCTTPSGPPIITSVAVPRSVDPNEDGSYTLNLTVWFADDVAVVDAFDFQSSAVTLDKQPLASPVSTGAAPIAITLPATTPQGTFDFTIDVSAGGVTSDPFSDAVVLR